MKGYDFLEKLNDVDPELLAEADKKPRKKTSPIVQVGALAACLALVIVGVTAVRSRPPHEQENEPLPRTEETEPAHTDEGDPEVSYSEATVSLSAEELVKLFAGTKEDQNARTSQYEKLYAGPGGMSFPELPEYTKTLPVYAFRPVGGGEEALDQAAETLFPVLKELTGLRDTEIPLAEETDYQGKRLWYATNEENDIFTFFGIQRIQNTIHAYCSTSDRLRPLGEYLSVPADVSDENLKELLTPLLEKLTELTGFSCPELYAERQYGYEGLKYLMVTVCDGAEETLISGLPRSFSHAFELEFATDWGEGSYHHWGGDRETVYLTRLTLIESYAEFPDVFTVQDYAEAISLTEAEEMLEKGYVFGGHSCPLCMAQQAEVDFSGYDAVTLEYVPMEDGSYFPFYAFYCDMGENSYGTPVYARTYVSALKLEGIDEYFASQESFHN